MTTNQLPRRRFLKHVAQASVGMALPACLFNGLSWAFSADEPLDLVIVGGTLIDGTGEARCKGDLGIRDGRIVAVGDLSDRRAERRLDAKGMVVAPGFIDIHTHSDTTLLRDGLAQSAVRQGVTTHVIGNCGDSPAPRERRPADDAYHFRTYGEFLAALVEPGLSVNVCGLVGHNRIRQTVMGMERRRPSESELVRMCDHVDEAMRVGAVGISTGLVTPPGAYAETSEIVELARVVAHHGGLYASHIRGEAGTLSESVAEAIEIGRKAGVAVEVSHHKAAGKSNWGKTRLTLPMLEQAAERGQVVHTDAYPYRAGSAGLTQLIPPWAHEGGVDKMLDRLRDSATRTRIVHDMTEGTADWPNFFVIDWDDIQIAGVAGETNRRWEGRRIGELAHARGVPGVEACLDLVLEERARVRMVNFVMDDEEVRRVLAHPLTMIGSDGSAIAPEWAEGKPHPRSYGCYPRLLGRYVREEKLFSLETAVHKMTQMPADQLALADRGRLKIGLAADVVVFDPGTITDRATFDEPHQYPDGIGTVIVNGQLVVHEREHLGARPGKILRPQGRG
jgi:N-acyl-D-amino-acid deacylase